MRSQVDRDDQTITIASALSIFVLVLVAGSLAYGLLSWLTDPAAAVGQVMAVGAFVGALALSGLYLLRHRRH